MVTAFYAKIEFKTRVTWKNNFSNETMCGFAL